MTTTDPTADTANADTANADTANANTATVQAIYEAFGRGDVPAILECLADDVEWERFGEDHGVPWLEPGRGKDHAAGFFGRLAGSLELTRFEPGAPAVGDGVVVVPVMVSGRVLHNGAEFDDFDVHFWWFDADGRVAGFKHVVDTAKHVAAFTR